jgi:hypothetical protein
MERWLVGIRFICFAFIPRPTMSESPVRLTLPTSCGVHLTVAQQPPHCSTVTHLSPGNIPVATLVTFRSLRTLDLRNPTLPNRGSRLPPPAPLPAPRRGSPSRHRVRGRLAPHASTNPQSLDTAHIPAAASTHQAHMTRRGWSSSVWRALARLTYGDAYKHSRYKSCTTSVPASKDSGFKSARVWQARTGVWPLTSRLARRGVVERATRRAKDVSPSFEGTRSSGTT